MSLEGWPSAWLCYTWPQLRTGFHGGVLPLRVNAHYSHKYNKDQSPGSNQGSQETMEKDSKSAIKV